MAVAGAVERPPGPARSRAGRQGDESPERSHGRGVHIHEILMSQNVILEGFCSTLSLQDPRLTYLAFVHFESGEAIKI